MVQLARQKLGISLRSLQVWADLARQLSPTALGFPAGATYDLFRKLLAAHARSSTSSSPPNAIRARILRYRRRRRRRAHLPVGQRQRKPHNTGQLAGRREPSPVARRSLRLNTNDYSRKCFRDE